MHDQSYRKLIDAPAKDQSYMAYLTYPYKLKRFKILFCLVFVFLYVAGLRSGIDDGHVKDIVKARVLFYFFLSIGVGGIYVLIASLFGKPHLTLSATTLAAPGCWIHNIHKNYSIPLASIRSIELKSVNKERHMIIKHSKGKLTIREGFLPDKKDFDSVYNRLISQLRTRAF